MWEGDESMEIEKRVGRPKVTHYENCKSCGRVFVQDYIGQNNCSDCRSKFIGKGDRRYIRSGIDIPKKTIAEIAKLAAEEHLTYGQYVAKHRRELGEW